MIKPIDFNGFRSLQISSGTARSIISLDSARLLSFSNGPREALHFDPSRPNRSSHPCGPIFGALSLNDPKVKDGLYRVGDKTFKLDQHGFLRSSTWTPVEKECSESRAVIELTSTDNPALKENYPFDFAFKQAVTLSPVNHEAKGKGQIYSLLYSLSFTNLTKDAAAPVDLGWHGYFPWSEGLRLIGLSTLNYNDETDWDDQNRKDLRESAIVFGHSADRDWHFSRFGANEALRDNFYFLYDDDKKTDIEIKGKEVKQIVVWTSPSEGRFICFEPVLRGRNSLNSHSPLMIPPNGGTVSLDFIIHLAA